MYNVNFFGGFIVSASVYYLLCRVSPIPATSNHWLEVDDDETGRNNSLVYGIEAYDAEGAYEQPDSMRDMKGAVAKTVE